jgi:hypothetical protein
MARPILAALALITVGTPALAKHAHPGGIEHAQLLDTINLGAPLGHVQGVDLDPAHIWVTSVDTRQKRGYLYEFDRPSGRLLHQIELTDGPRFHPGGLSIDGNSIWVPVAEYRKKSSAVIEQIDIASLNVVRRIAVDDHLGCVAANGHTLVAGNWDSRRLYLIDLDNDAMRVVPNPNRTRYQDMKFVDGQLVAGGYVNRHGGTIDWIDFPSMHLVRSLHTGSAGHGAPLSHAQVFTGEGMALQGRDLYVLPDSRYHRLFHFQLDDSVAAATALR